MEMASCPQDSNETLLYNHANGNFVGGHGFKVYQGYHAAQGDNEYPTILYSQLAVNYPTSSMPAQFNVTFLTTWE